MKGGWVGGRGGNGGGEPAGEEWEEIQGGDGSLICRLPLLHERWSLVVVTGG